MNVLTVTQKTGDWNATPDLEKIINGAPEGSTVSFEAGVYPLMSAVKIKGKKNLTLEGEGAVLAPYFSRETGVKDGSEVFHLLDCENLTIRGFEVCATEPVNSAGEIVAVTDEYADVKMNSTLPLTGKEQFISGLTFDEDWCPAGGNWVRIEPDPAQRTVIAGEIPCSAPTKLNVPHEMIGDQTIRVYSVSHRWTKAGERCNVSHAYYGLVAFTFRQCRGVTVENVKMTNFGGFGFLILPHCRDFTFRGLDFVPRDRSRQPYSINSDGIHLTGLSGKLVIEDCKFDCIGDDCLNAHTQVMTVKASEGERLSLVYDKIGGLISPYWSETGDKLRVYDPETLVLKGKVTVATADRGEITLEPSDVKIAVGDYVTNDKYYPEITVRRCRFSRRARALVLQGASAATVEDCTFEQVHSSVLYCSTAFDYWMEAGPVENVTVRNNVFTGNGRWKQKEGVGVIYVRVNGERHQNIAPVHKNVCIENNRFENLSGPAVSVQLTDGVTVRGNKMQGGSYIGQKILIDRCTSVLCEENTEV